MFSKDELELLRQHLLTRIDELRREIDVKRAEAAADRSTLMGGTDAGDLSSAESERDIELAEAERDFAEIRQARAVLARIEDGHYGLCSDCGRDIAPERLKAQPLALRCVNCQSVVERRRGDHHSTL